MDESTCNQLVDDRLPFDPDVVGTSQAERQVIDDIEARYQAWKPQLEAWADAMDGVREYVQNRGGTLQVGPIAYALAVGSIKTNTRSLDVAIERNLADKDGKLGQDDLFKFLSDDVITDSDTKVEAFQRLFEVPDNGGNPSIMRSLDKLRTGDPIGAVAEISEEDGYLGPVKAPMAVRWCGYSTPCMDINVRREMRPFLQLRAENGVEWSDIPADRRPEVASDYENVFENHDAERVKNWDTWIDPERGEYRICSKIGRTAKYHPPSTERYMNKIGAQSKTAPYTVREGHRTVMALFGMVAHEVANRTDVPSGLVQTIMFLKGAQTNELQTSIADAMLAHIGENKANKAPELDKLQEIDGTLPPV